MDRISDYDYELPAELIAATPAAERDAARMLIVNRARGTLTHATVRDLPGALRPHDCLVLNDTRVLPARLLGRRAATGGRWEGLFLGATPEGHWRLLSQSRGRLQNGEQVTVIPAHAPDSPERLTLTLLDREPEGIFLFRPEWAAGRDRAAGGCGREQGGWGRAERSPQPGAHNARDADMPGAFDLLQHFGMLPLPPYIRRDLATANDFERYQTTYATVPGAVAAPTAGLHLTPELLRACEAAGARRCAVTLHVGVGTFRPVSVENLGDHRMHAEWCEIAPQTVDRIRAARAAGGRIVAVGTTTVRTLESASLSGELQPFRGETDIFLRPPWTFRSVDVLLTNFHLPRSTLLVLVSAFAGRELIRAAYAEAIAQRYRFFSYGDAMLIV